MDRRVGVLLIFCFGVVLAGAVSCEKTNYVAGVYCNTNDDCKDPAYPVCEPVNHACIAGTDMNVCMPSSCTLLDGGRVDADLAGCEGTCKDGGGTDAARDLEPPPDLEPFCTQDGAASCTDPTKPICAATLESCRACASSSDDDACKEHSGALPRCNSTTGQCVACRTDTQATDCATATAPICDTSSNTCRACKAHSECSSGICDLHNTDGAQIGRCVTPAEIATLDSSPSPGPCTDVTGTPSYCHTAAAVASAKHYILVVGHGEGSPYDNIVISGSAAPGTTLTIVGPGKAATAPAFLNKNGSAGASVASTTSLQQATVVLDGLDVRGSAGPDLDGVDCTASAGGTAKLSIYNSSIHDSGAVGVSSSGCTLVVDASSISNNGGGGAGAPGVSCSSSTAYTLTNDIIASNGTSAGNPGILISDTGSTGTIAFVTLSKNGGLNSIEGGMQCPSAGANKVIQDSIVVNNSTNGGTQFAGHCTLTNVVTGTADSKGLNTTNPTFVSSSNFRLVASDSANLMCCIDKAASPGTPNADHDVDLTQRPKGASATPYDYGAQEVQ